MYLCINQCIDGEGGHNSEELPFACFLCRSDFVNPIITLCGHYYCSNCILAYVKGQGDSSSKSDANKEGSKSGTKDKSSGGSNSKCPICDKQMYGVFNRGTKLIKKLQSTTSTTATTTASTSTTAGGSSVSSSKRPKSSFVFVDE